MLSRLKEYFKTYGVWKEDFKDFEFFGRLEVSLVHEVFLLKDYEINSNFYLFGKRVGNRKEAESIFEKVKRNWREFITIQRDHYLSAVVLVFLSDEAFSVEELYSEKFLWFGIKGKVVFVGGVLKSDLRFPKKVKDREVGRFLDFLKASIG